MLSPLIFARVFAGFLLAFLCDISFGADLFFVKYLDIWGWCGMCVLLGLILGVIFPAVDDLLINLFMRTISIGEVMHKVKMQGRPLFH